MTSTSAKGRFVTVSGIAVPRAAGVLRLHVGLAPAGASYLPA